jgi:hypothetical protein
VSNNVKNLYGLCAGCSNAIVDEDFVVIAGSRYHNDSGCLPAVGHHQVEEVETYEIQTDDPETEQK